MKIDEPTEKLDGAEELPIEQIIHFEGWPRRVVQNLVPPQIRIIVRSWLARLSWESPPDLSPIESVLRLTRYDKRNAARRFASARSRL